MKRLVLISGILLTALGLFYLSCVHFTDQYHIAITRNFFSGQVHCDTQGGFHVTPPWVQATRIDTRPQRVCITSASRAVNCKLVEFEPNHYQKFVAVEGFRYYWWANRISFNLGYTEEYRGMKDILRGHAFGTERYPFIKVLDDYPDP